jgi:hypothetical protein
VLSTREVAHHAPRWTAHTQPSPTIFFAIGYTCLNFVLPVQDYSRHGHRVRVSCMDARNICTTSMLSRPSRSRSYKKALDPLAYLRKLVSALGY